jgi:hypothetical protein
MVNNWLFEGKELLPDHRMLFPNKEPNGKLIPLKFQWFAMQI